MARRAITDPLQVMRFWLFDASVVEALQLPVFSPLMGFKSISMPEISLDTQEIKEGNWLFSKKVVKNGSISNITLETASTFNNSDFWRWMIVALTGDTSGSRWFSGNQVLQQVIGGVSPRKTLVLVHFFPRNPSLPTANAQDRNRAQASGVSPFQQFGPGELVPRVPAKAWILHGCLPVRMKPGSDFDATSADISIQELEVSIEGVEEISLADPF